MDEQHHRMRAVPLGFHDPAVHLLPAVVREAPLMERPTQRGRLAGDRDRRPAPVVKHAGGLHAVGVHEPHRPVGSYARPADRPRRGRESRRRSRPEVEAVQLLAALERVPQEHGGGIGPPVVDRHVAGKIHRQVGPRPGGEVPDRGALAIAGLVRGGQPTIAGGRGPRGRHHRGGSVSAFAEDRAGPGLDDPQRGVRDVAVLRMLQREERAVRRQPGGSAALERAGDRQPFGAPRDLLRGFPLERHEDREPAVALAHTQAHDARRLREALAPPHRDPVEERDGAPTVERLHEPSPGLVAGVLLPEQHRGAVDRGLSRRHAHRVLGDATPIAGGDVPRVHLPDAGLVRGVDGSVGGGRRPSGQRHPRSAEPSLPHGHV